MNIEPRDFTIEKLTCLIGHLKKRNPAWNDVAVLFFSSEEAADNFNPDINYTPGILWNAWARHQHASYLLEPDKKEYLYISPFGFKVVDFSLDTKIDLPVATRPKCRLETAGRCLMAVLGEIKRYPESALKHATVGRVTLSAVIERDGSTSHVTVKDADVRPIERKELLTSAAMQNLKTWQFDASDQESPIQIDYSYVIDTGPLARTQYSGQVTMIPKLPYYVEIRVKAPK
ncbi:MAG: energy transducer TonB [Candidatus Koribacter versatilis]|uniref:Energy transducer TonB n=1 Tax=Candidatus Korobacter versatilis TaxID=658062 RepID=A0A932EQT4_9BACT|nr:energy transducer TonB [Candidatus Koribacter versatilis]